MSLKPYSEYKDSGVEWFGLVPAEWIPTKLGRHIAINSGLVDPKSEPFSDMIMVAPNHIESWTGKIKYTETAAQQGAESGKYQVYKGQIIYSKIRPNLMKAAIAPFDCLCSADMYGVDADGDMLSNSFLTYYFLSHEFHDYAVDQSARVAMPKLNHETLKATPIFLPPIQDQWAIASYLDRETAEIDVFIADQEELIALLGERRTATITRAVTKGLDPETPMKNCGLEWLGDVPAGWTVQRLSHVTSAVIDCLHSTPEESDEGKFISIRTGCIRNGRLLPEKGLTIDELTFRERTAKGTPEVGDVFFTREAPAGEAALVDNLGQYALGQRMVLLKPSSELLDSRFLVWNIYMPHVRRYIEVEANGSTVKNLPIPDIKSIPIIVPRRDQQQRIIEYLNQEITEIDTVIADAREAIKLSKERRAAVISAAVTGKIDVRGFAAPAAIEMEAESVGVA
ncbi:restriction endonuclease subunit S [Paeniglutamicibacter psychrophenolicus]|uniref:Type I restriction enzyme S subunit n=1 Tax=Paeniglutamicibacter psychrophenolicus TaxID=257454 RepID=A0ABS4WHE6_9MICC|nr:restriction endonuclease subunit S [Paeniglutamicibacter psychrophenolicus]MBP2375622.1 type I restriction enzyme S subunit [Paeniglutamicibacter psychrophenolicus]